MNDERSTIHLPDAREPDEQQPELGLEQEAAKPTTADLARAGEVTPDNAADRPTGSGDGSPTAAPASGEHQTDDTAPLFPGDEAGRLNQRWSAIQVGFVDEPRKAVEDADTLVASAMTRLAEMFAAERAGLEGQWDRGGEVSTEDLRQALRRYRAFFGRLLAV